MTIFFFGGYLSNNDDVFSWANSVEKKVPNTIVVPFPYPRNATSGDPLHVWNYSKTVASMVRNDDLIVGHSSGCAIANDVADTVVNQYKITGFHLIVLDGFKPCQTLLALPNTSVWSAANGNIHSRNYDALSDSPNFNVYHTSVKSQWPLHFSLLNLNVSDNHSKITEGYYNCDANLDVLK
jgi:hypothetical protein